MWTSGPWRRIQVQIGKNTVHTVNTLANGLLEAFGRNHKRINTEARKKKERYAIPPLITRYLANAVIEGFYLI